MFSPLVICSHHYFHHAVFDSGAAFPVKHFKSRAIWEQSFDRDFNFLGCFILIDRHMILWLSFSRLNIF
jgi:hypothetical protein